MASCHEPGDCGTDFESLEAAPACPTCGTLRVTRAGGDDLVLEWIEYRDTAPAT